MFAPDSQVEIVQNSSDVIVDALNAPQIILDVELIRPLPQRIAFEVPGLSIFRSVLVLFSPTFICTAAMLGALPS